MIGLFILSFTAVCLGQAPSCQQSNSSSSSTSKPDIYGLINILYLKADANVDSHITHSELSDVFKGFDKNGDGTVTQAEFVELWELLTGQPQELADAYFHLGDVTDDTVIDNHDYPIIYKVFDLNHDGSVSAHEFVTKWEDIIRETPFAVLFERSDANKDEFLTRAEFRNLFSSFDSNHDRMVSKAEFSRGWSCADFALLSDSDVLFSVLDTNHDGSITGDPDMDHFFTQDDANMDGKMALQEAIQMKSLLVIHQSGSGSPVGK